jgi:hypothetical protein
MTVFVNSNYTTFWDSTGKPEGCMDPIVTDLAAAVLGFLGAIGGAYLGARWSIEKLREEQRIEQRKEKREHIREFLAENEEELAAYMMRNEGIPETRDRLERRIRRLEIYLAGDDIIKFLDDLGVAVISIPFAGDPWVSLDPLRDRLEQLTDEIEGQRRPARWQFWK